MTGNATPPPAQHNADVIELDAQSRLHYIESYLEAPAADTLFEFCQQNLAWQQSQIQLFGKRVPIPRLNAWYGDAGYSYSGTSFDATTWPQDIECIKANIEQTFKIPLNSVLANLYRTGNDSMGWHSDDEKSLGEAPQIASLSLGASRRFVLRDKQDHQRKHELLLPHGSLLLMLGKVQARWQHSLPKTTKVQSPRVNLTFRNVVS
jgi:alkylated DNA repair dioxygenase AlkB